jgi:hypothetical protein
LARNGRQDGFAAGRVADILTAAFSPDGQALVT